MIILAYLSVKNAIWQPCMKKANIKGHTYYVTMFRHLKLMFYTGKEYYSTTYLVN